MLADSDFDEDAAKEEEDRIRAEKLAAKGGTQGTPRDKKGDKGKPKEEKKGKEEGGEEEDTEKVDRKKKKKAEAIFGAVYETYEVKWF